MYEVPISYSVWCHGCKKIRWHVNSQCATCGKEKHVAELICTYSDSDGLITLPLHALATKDRAFAMRNKWLT